MEQLINSLVTAGVGLVFLGASYALDLLVGTIKVIFTDQMKWSWKKMLEDLVKALLIAIGTEMWVALWYFGTWFAQAIGLNIDEYLNAISIVGVIGAIGGGGFWYLMNAGQNLLNFLNTKHVKVDVDENKADYNKVKKLVDTLVKKPAKEDIKDGESTEIDTSEAGLGGITNTYVEPYRSKPKDTILDPSTCWNRECVSYCAWKITESKGVWDWPLRTGPMSAKYWCARLESWGYKKVAAPKNGGKYVGVNTSGEYGHVVWFEFDNTISEYNYASAGNFGVREINLKQYIWYEIVAAPKPKPTPTPTPTKQVKYTYKAGDTFGQVIVDLGLKTSHGLWGPDGDVAYYTGQLHEQGIYGNIPIGTTIVLTPRVD